MEAKTTEAFKGRPDKEILTRDIEVGEIITGDLARVAIREGWAQEVVHSEPPALDVDLGSMNKAQLATHGMELYDLALGDSMTKAEMITAIEEQAAGAD